MTTAITTTTANHLHSDALPLLDLRLLSHSDLLSLSLSSSSSLSLKNDADLSTPKIDRSVFNESAGSRKQTFSRLRLAPPQFASDSKSSLRNRNQIQNQTNVIEKESPEIVSLLKSFFGCDNEDVEENDESALPSVSVPVAIPLQYSEVFDVKKLERVNVKVSVREESGAKKRKRGRPRRDERNLGVGSESEGIVACNDAEKEGEDVKVSEEGGGENVSAEDVNVKLSEAGGEGVNAMLENAEDVNVKVIKEEAESGNTQLENAEDVTLKVSKEGGEGENAQLENGEDVNGKVNKEGGEGENAHLESAEVVNVNVSEEGGEGENALLERVEDVNVNVNVSVPTALGAKKRKRGRPKKDERNLRIASENKPIVVYNDVKKEEVGERGNVQAEDPYIAELRRKTEGMQTKGELVGYLEGVKGAWVGGRRKSRVVNAAEFGGVLPTGWKLMISVKRRAGLAWLACKRYISPNGQQFVSCKEASSYLHSLSGLQGASLTDSAHKDSRVHLTQNLSSGNGADSSVKDDKNVDEPVRCSALPISPFIDKHEKQTTSLKIESSTELPGGKEYKCHKCSMTFNEPDYLLQHFQMSHQKVPKRHRHAASVTEEAILIDGKYQCQLCDKSYEERHRFNGHLGNHIKDYLKRLDMSGRVAKSQQNSMPTSTAALSIDLMIKPIEHGSNDLKSSGVKYSEIQSTTSAETCEQKHGGAFSVGSDVVDEVNGARNAVPAKIVASLGAEPALLSDKRNTILERSDEKKVLECTIDGASNVCKQVNCQSSSHGASIDQACTVNNSLNWISANLEVDINLEKASVSSFNAPATMQKTSGDCKPPDEAKVLECTVGGSNNVGSQVSSQSSSLHASRDQAGAANYNLNQLSIDLVADHNLEKAHLSCSNAQAGMQNRSGNCNNEDEHLSGNIETMEIHRNLVRKEEQITGHDISDEVVPNNVIGNNKKKKFVAPSGNRQRDLNVSKTNSSLPSTMRETFCERGSKGGSLSSSEGKTYICRSDVFNVSSGVLNESKFDELGKSGFIDQSIEYGANSTVTIEEVATSKGELSYGNYSAVESIDRTPNVDDNIYGTFKSTANLPCPEKGTETTQLNLSSSKQTWGFKPDIKVNSAADVHSQNRFPGSENEFIGGNDFDSRSESNNELHNSSSVWLVPPANSQIFPPTNSGNFNRNPVEKLTPYRNPVEKLAPHRNPVDKPTPHRNPMEKPAVYRNPDSSLHRPSDCKHTHYDKNSVNGTRTESYEHNEVRRSFNAESHIGFGHGGTELESNVSFEAAQESDSKEYPLYPPGYQPTVHTEQLTSLYGSNMHAQKQTRNSTDGSSWLSGREQPQIVENNLSWDFMGGNHTEPRLEDSKISRKNEALNGFKNQILSNEHPMLDFMWRNDDLLRGFVDTSSHVGQTEGGFPACDVMSDKGQSAFFGEKFDGTSAFEGLRSGGMGNMEFNFLTSFMDSESSESKTNAFNAGEAQGYGSSVWPQKDALPLLPKTARQHPVTCSYCRNEFQYDSFESAAQANSMGFVCVSCKAKFSSPFNFL